MPSRRSERVGAELQAALAEVIRRDLKDPRVGQITVTGVDMSPDLKHARVFVAPFGDAGGDAILRGLKSAAPFLQAQVGRRLRLKYTPELRFALDRSFDDADHIEGILRTLHPPDDESK